jgi:selenide,water dikinase
MHEARCPVLGGHSVNDAEIKFGYSVTGSVHPDRIKANSGARAGDVLVFTKRIGTGIVSTALKRSLASDADVAASIESMLTLNRDACEAMLAFDVHGCTDVSGFGLLGHAREMAVASAVTLEIDSRRVQFLPGAVNYAQQGAIPGGLQNNRAFVSSCVEGASEYDDLLYDPQTSGGLLISLREADAAALELRFPAAYRIGRVIERAAKPIRLL